MRVIIAGGGTGGHLFPGLAIAEELKSRDKKTEVIFVGTEYGIEAKVVPREGYPIKFLRAEGMVGVSPVKKMRAIAKMFVSTFDSYKIIQNVKPDIMIGVGGYASGAIMLIAAFMSIPTMILEQNCVPGLTNRILGKFVKAVCTNYQESIPYFPKGKTFLTGNPVRMHVLRGSSEFGYKLFSLERGL
ncbi:MAG TPA: glycosyltransferase, partial [Thermodesulfovibrionales bacterium]|nr:glycosyltransferase [Thermodesulfovibrionales bacterium]